MAPTALSDIGHVIQLAIAPVFLLTGVGALLNVLASRLGRAVDRRRVLVSPGRSLDEAVSKLAYAELDYIERRVHWIYLSISLAVVCALFICLLIALAFIDAFITLDLAKIVAALFIASMAALIGSLGAFLREIFLGVTTVRCPIR